MSQPPPRQQSGGSDRQFWQQQLMYKQLLELQRQKQRAHLDQGARQQNSLNHLSAVTKPVALNKSGRMNDIATNNEPNYMWPNNLVKSLPSMSDGHSQMLVAGNMNWTQSASSPSMQNVANGLIIPNDQHQEMQSLRHIPQQRHSFYGMPVSNTRASINQYHRLSRMSNDCDNSMTKAVENQPDKVLNQLNAFHNSQHFPVQGCLQDRISETTQNLQEKGFFVNTPGIFHNDGTPGNFQQANSMQNSVQDQAFCGIQDQVFWTENLQERVTEQAGTSHEASSLDPTEEKFLYGNDDDNWGPSFACSLNSISEGLLHGLPIVNDCFGGFPSMQSGSWSALMQEAVQSSTSDSGVQEEWSGLDFQKMEQSMSKTSVIFAENGKQLSAWDDSNVHATSSLASRSLSLFNATDAGPSLFTAPSFQHSYQSTYNENNGIQNGASNPSFQIGEGINKLFDYGQKQKHLSECNAQVQILENNGMWVGQTYQQQKKLSDLQNSISSWTRQQTFTSSNASTQSDNGPNDWNENTAVEPGAVSNSVFSADGSMWSTHVNPKGRVEKPVESDVGTSRVQTDGSFISTYGSFMNSNSPKFTQKSSQQVGNSEQVVFGKTFALGACTRTKGDENEGGNHTEPSERRPQSWESTKKDIDGSGNYQHSKIQSERFSEEAYASNNSDYLQKSDIFSGENKSPTWICKSSFVHWNTRPSFRSDQQATNSIMLQNQTATIGMNREASYGAHRSHIQDTDNPIFQESKSVDQAHVGKSDFNGHDLSNYITDVTKRTLTGVEEPYPRDISVHESTSFEPLSTNCSQNKNITQRSRNMLDLLPKVDHTRNSSTVAVSDNPAQLDDNAASPKSSTQVLGLRLAPPSQRHSSHTLFSSQSSVSTGKIRQHNAEVGEKYQGRSFDSPITQYLPQNNACQNDTLSEMSDDKPKMTADYGKQVNSSLTSVPGIPYPGKQQQAQFASGRTPMQYQQRHGHEILELSANFPVGKQTTLARNVSLPQQTHESLDGSVSAQSVLKSLTIPDGGVPSSTLAPLADISTPSSFKSSFAERENVNKMVADFHQVQNSNPFPETKSGAQSSLPGTSQQVGFSRMLHNVWTNISAQQRLAGLQPPKLTPQILQTIISNNTDTSLWTPQTTTEGADKGGTALSEVGTSYSQGYQSKSASLNQQYSVKLDAAPKTSMMSQGGVAWSAPSDGNSNVFVSSLVHLQQDLDKGKFGSDAILQTQISNATTIRGDVRLSGKSLLASDVQQQNYSLLHQIQAMRGSNSDQSRVLAGSLKGTDFTSNPQIEWNTGQRFVSDQISGFNVPPDGKVGATLQSSFPADVKKLNSTSMDNNEIHSSTSTATTGQHDFRNQMDTRSSNSAGNSIRGMEHTQIRPLMASSRFKQYESYKNGSVVTANFNGPWNPNASSHHHLFPKAPGSMGYNIVVDRTRDSGIIDDHGQSSEPATIVTKELSSPTLIPTVLEQSVVQRTKKRKSATLELISWNKVVTQSQQKIQSSIIELDWAQAVNRLSEKAECEYEAMEDNLSITQPQRRIILTTQLMQQLIPALPARMLCVEADIAYESVTFCVAKAALADACSMISCSGKDHHVSLEDERGASKRFKSSIGYHSCSMLLESYIGRSKKVENDFLRLERGASLFDVRMECQELEKFSIVNRLGKFHDRPHTDVAEGSSVSEIGALRMYIQRYVTALPVPGNLPEGVTYLSL